MSKNIILKFLFFFLWAYDLSAQRALAQTVSAIYGFERHPLIETSDQDQTLNIFGPGGQIVAQVVNGKIDYLLADHQRSTRVVLNEDNSLMGGLIWAALAL